MLTKKPSLASDNWSPAHPCILEALIQANQDCAVPYGSDPWTEQAKQILQKAFGRPCKALILPTGTGANIFALTLACRNHESAVCTDIAHINVQEAGAPERIAGCKLLTIFHDQGKATVEEVLKRVKKERAFGKHTTAPRLLSITQPTEVGTIYTLPELQALSALCKQENLFFHVDGSRLYNAAAALGMSLAEMFESVQIDLLSLGGTKNGLLAAESLLIFNPELEEGSDYLQKQTLQLTSKMRYFSAQYIPFFEKDLWRILAQEANLRAQQIKALIESIPQLRLSYPVQTNQIFVQVPLAAIPVLMEKVHCNLWDAEKGEIRLIASWNTTEEEIETLRDILHSLFKK